MSTYVAILNTVKFVNLNLNANNLNVMTRKIVALKIKSEWLMKTITELIYEQALNKPDYTVVYAQLCAMVIKNQRLNKQLVNSKKTFLTLLVPQCRNLLYSYKTNTEIPSQYIDVNHYKRHLLANCKFISELYNQKIFLEKTMRSIIDELLKETGHIQVLCLCSLLKSVCPKLAKTYNMANVLEHLESLKTQLSVDELPLEPLMNDVKYLQSKYWTPEDAREIIVEEEPHLISTTPDDKIPTAEYIYDECNNLLVNFSTFGEVNEVNQLLTPTIESLLHHDQVTFVVSMTLVAIDPDNFETRKDTGKILASLVNIKLLSKYLVHIGFDKVMRDDDTIALFENIQNLVSDIKSEYLRYCNR